MIVISDQHKSSRNGNNVARFCTGYTRKRPESNIIKQTDIYV